MESIQIVKRICSVCNSDRTVVRKAYGNRRSCPNWYHDKDSNWLCSRCYNRLINQPKYRKRHPDKVKDRYNKSNPRKFRYKDKIMLLKQNPRIGICSLCNKSVVKGEIKITQRHHYGEYDDSDPIRNTIEVCVPCHNKKRKGMKYKKP